LLDRDEALKFPPLKKSLVLAISPNANKLFPWAEDMKGGDVPRGSLPKTQKTEKDERRKTQTYKNSEFFYFVQHHFTYSYIKEQKFNRTPVRSLNKDIINT